MIVGGGGVALFHLPLFGQVAAGVIALVVIGIGQEEARARMEEWVKVQNFWPAVRWLITDAKAEKMRQEARKELHMGLKQGFEKTDHEAKKKPDGKTLARKVTDRIEAGIRQRAHDSILLFEKKGLDDHLL